MRRRSPILGLGALAALSVPTVAAEDPVAVRQALMANVGAAAAVAGGVMQGEVDYSPVIGRATIAALYASSVAYGDFFPDASRGDARSSAAATVWDDRAGFDAQLARFQAAAAEAVRAAGREGPPDADAFRAAIQPVLGACRSCHEDYRVQD